MTQIIILCGGKGSRMRDLSAYPKPLVKIGGVPILKYLIDFFYKNKHKKIILATGYKSKKVEYFVERNFKNKITISDSGNVDILDRLKKISPLIMGDFLICYGDTLANINLKKLTNKAKQNKKLITVTLAKLNIDFGIAELKNDRVSKFIERPVLNNKNIGFFYCKKDLIKHFTKSKNWVNFLKKMANNGNMGFYIHKNNELTVNTPSELVVAKEKIKTLYK